MAILTKEQIWSADDIVERVVEVPQWGGEVKIRTFTKKQADAMVKQATVKDRFGKESQDNQILEALLFTEGIVEPSFDYDDYERLQEKSAVAVSLILKAIMDASGLSATAVSEADKSDGEEPDARVRLLSSVRAKDDVRRTTGEDERK